MDFPTNIPMSSPPAQPSPDPHPHPHPDQQSQSQSHSRPHAQAQSPAAPHAPIITPMTPTPPILTASSPADAFPPPRPPRAARRAAGQGALQDDSLRSVMLRLDRHGQLLLDKVAPFKLYRWVGLTVLLLIFLLRMFLLEGFYIVAYVLFIFILNQFILFLQPKDRAALLARASSSSSASAGDDATTQQVEGNSGNSNGTTTMGNEEDVDLPTLDDDEFRPFVRRLPEFKFWYSTTYATFLAFCATFFKAFDVPVFWPLLLFYFVMLFVATMRRQWLDMKKLKYVPWDIGSKKVYKSDPKHVSVQQQLQTPQRHVQQPGGVGASTTRPQAPIPTIQVKKLASASA